MSPRHPDGRRPRPAEAAYAGHLLFGILMALLGAILPELAAGLGVDLAQAGRLFLLMNACILLVSLVLGPLMDRFGTKPPLVVGPLLAGAGLVAVALATRSAALGWAVLLLGLGGGALNGSANTLIAELHDGQAARSAALNRLGVFYGIGALVVPLALGLLLGKVALGVILLAAAVLCVLVAARNARTRVPPPGLVEPPPATRVLALLRGRFVPLFAALLFFQAGNEFVVGGFTTSYLVGELGFSLRAASWALTGYWAALMLSRVAFSRLALRIDGRRLVVASALLSAAGTAMLASARHPAVAALAVVWIGVAIAGIFPTALGIVAARHPTMTGTVIGLLLTAALAGGMLVPWLAGLIGEAHGLRPAFAGVAVQFVASAALAVAAGPRGAGAPDTR